MVYKGEYSSFKSKYSELLSSTNTLFFVFLSFFAFSVFVRFFFVFNKSLDSFKEEILQFDKFSGVFIFEGVKVVEDKVNVFFVNFFLLPLFLF